MTDPSLFYLLQVIDSSFPIGAFSHSYGLETYTQQGIVCDEQSSRMFLENTLTYNTFFNDAAFVAWAYRYGEQQDEKALLILDREVSALKTAIEIRTASKKLATRFLKVIASFSISNPVLSAYATAIFDKQTEGHFALVFGLYCQQTGISLENTLTAFYYNSAASIVTNCAKLIPLSQMTGQKILFQIQPLIVQLVRGTINLLREEIGRSTPEFDIKAMQHQNLYSRLYMS
ncbi:urease accessory protein UreF [Pedobacter sp. L105]|uniref:urease accessory protein UreF n=1 Tax=Pedobacter sp. L105 TaxID=1641871 RepID=UPI00131B6A3C|nr:urease accessory protein UreF [Pedobacter sp. L105]